ncbi:hypothetical protein PENDEC_c003G03871 [Penicillium decumbens]|uniref:Uncharacterized protein n=1 Tax=Penicillium decumbens TaxID=69771 RepID=A0A1V6PJI5_PENDC|nr:hypothetical protein PENDEC_c003G03871 [Penicillium decumbens]
MAPQPPLPSVPSPPPSPPPAMTPLNTTLAIVLPVFAVVAVLFVAIWAFRYNRRHPAVPQNMSSEQADAYIRVYDTTKPESWGRKIFCFCRRWRHRDLPKTQAELLELIGVEVRRIMEDV